MTHTPKLISSFFFSTISIYPPFQEVLIQLRGRMGNSHSVSKVCCKQTSIDRFLNSVSWIIYSKSHRTCLRLHLNLYRIPKECPIRAVIKSLLWHDPGAACRCAQKTWNTCVTRRSAVGWTRVAWIMPRCRSADVLSTRFLDALPLTHSLTHWGVSLYDWSCQTLTHLQYDFSHPINVWRVIVKSPQSVFYSLIWASQNKWLFLRAHDPQVSLSLRPYSIEIPVRSHSPLDISPLNVNPRSPSKVLVESIPLGPVVGRSSRFSFY